MEIKDVLNRSEELRYQLLGRLRSDCEYYLNFGMRDPNVLWAKNVPEQIKYMKSIWKSFDKKPVWLTYKQILDFEKRMKHNNKLGRSAK